MADPDVTNKKGIYLFVLNEKEMRLSIRQFDARMRREAFERQKGKCPDCGENFTIEEMEADYIKPWHEGGKTEAGNCQMLCIQDNRKKKEQQRVNHGLGLGAKAHEPEFSTFQFLSSGN